MAMINCGDCGASVSTEAKICPGCGASQRRAGMHGLLPANFDVTCDCGREFGVPLSDLEGDFACPGCGKVGRFTAEQVAAIHAVAKGADDKVLGSLGALMDRPKPDFPLLGRLATKRMSAGEDSN